MKLKFILNKSTSGESKMKKAVFILYLFAIAGTNLFSQNIIDDSLPGVSSGYVSVEGGKLFYEIAGKGDYIVLLHDGIAHREVWDGQFKFFAERYKVVRYDRRGYGKSTFPDASFSHIEDLNQVLIHLKIEKAIIFGISGGGELAIDFALKYPSKVNSLVLVGAVASGFKSTSHSITRGGRVGSIINLSNEPEKFLQYFVWEDPYEIYKDNIKAKGKLFHLLKTNPNDVNFKSRTFVKPADRPAINFLSEINIPVLVLVGEYDMPDIHANAGIIEIGIPNAKREIIYNSGHIVPLEQPEAFNSSALKFLSGIEFFSILNSQGTAAASQYFQKRRETEPDVVMFDEGEMNMMGYGYLQTGKTKDAIEVFKLNTIAYSGSWNVFDSLAEAYMNDGQTELAIKNYEKSLKLNPKNKNAEDMLKKLKGH